MNLEGMMEMGWEFQPNHQTIEQIWDEIEALHRRVRLLTIGLIAVVVLCNCLPSLIWFLLPVKPFGAIQVERIEFVRDFQTVLKFVPAPMGNAIFIQDKEDRIIAGIGEVIEKWGGSIVLFNPNMTISVGLSTNPNGGVVAVMNKDGKSCVHLSGGPLGGLLLIKSPQGQVLFRAP
jgi:hypothetical protein